MRPEQEPPVEFEFRQGVVHVRHLECFALTPAVSAWLWAKVARLCDAHGCDRVLRSGPTPSRAITPLQASEAARSLPRLPLRVACCYPGYGPDKSSAAFASAALEHGIVIRYFESEDAGLAWLNQPSPQ